MEMPLPSIPGVRSKTQIIRESKRCPVEYQTFLTRIGGKNPYGQPNFRMVWGETLTESIWGQMDGGSCGQHIKLKYNGQEKWILEMWKPPEEFGIPEIWYEQSRDPETGLHLCGDFPFQGDYVAHSKHQYLSFSAIEELLPRILHAKQITYKKRREMVLERKAAEQRETDRMAEDAYRDATPAFGGVAGTYESNREKLMARLNFRMNARQAQQRIRSGADVQRWAAANPQLSQEEINRICNAV